MRRVIEVDKTMAQVLMELNNLVKLPNKRFWVMAYKPGNKTLYQLGIEDYETGGFTPVSEYLVRKEMMAVLRTLINTLWHLRREGVV